MRVAAAYAVIACLTACSKPATVQLLEQEQHEERAPLSIEQLRDHEFDTSLTYERALDAGRSFTAYLVSYMYAGFELHAMVAVPTSVMPEDGFPIVIANHGYVPDPTKYGIMAAGVDSRPGEYYRSVPELYASRGFLVVIPDYRGHNSSEGFDYVDGKDAVGYCAEDVVALMSALNSLQQADLNNVFMWSHSMGGGVSIRALLVTDIVKASSFWSTISVDDLAAYFGDLDRPVMIQHSTGDNSTQHSNSVRLAGALRAIGQPFEYHSYVSEDHYFEGEIRELAADQDAAFFSLR